VHRDLLVHHSPFFNAALNGQFLEGHSQTVRLPEEGVEAFGHFVYWMYAEKLDDGFMADGKPSFFLLLHLYGLADRLAIERLRNDTLDELARLAELANAVPTPSDTFLVYERLRASAPARALVLDLFTFKKTENLLERHPDAWHPEFLRELVLRLKRPGRVALDRHRFARWVPASWHRTKACDVCRSVLPPHGEALQCLDCARAVCHACVRRATDARPACLGSVDHACKPWKRDMCFYHEHQVTPPCHGDGRSASEAR
jgi:hypothetical protein